MDMSNNEDRALREVQTAMTAEDLSRRQKALKIVVLVSEGMTISEACRDVGISRATFSEWLTRPEVATFVMEMSTQAQMKALMQTFGKLDAGVDRMLQIIESGSSRDAIAAFNALVTYTERVQERMQVVVDANNAAKQAASVDKARNRIGKWKPSFPQINIESATITVTSKDLDQAPPVVIEGEVSTLSDASA